MNVRQGFRNSGSNLQRSFCSERARRGKNATKVFPIYPRSDIVWSAILRNSNVQHINNVGMGQRSDNSDLSLEEFDRLTFIYIEQLDNNSSI